MLGQVLSVDLSSILIDGLHALQVLFEIHLGELWIFAHFVLELLHTGSESLCLLHVRPVAVRRNSQLCKYYRHLFKVCLPLKQRFTNKHLSEQAANRPHVNGLSVLRDAQK